MTNQEPNQTALAARHVASDRADYATAARDSALERRRCRQRPASTPYGCYWGSVIARETGLKLNAKAATAVVNRPTRRPSDMASRPHSPARSAPRLLTLIALGMCGVTALRCQICRT